MYLQITTLCNMACEHCCFRCGPTKPFEHMSEGTYRHCIDLEEQTGGFPSIGGGEPTCHPEFWSFLRYAVQSDVESVWMATNGKRRKHALLLAMLGGRSEIDFYDLFYPDPELPEDDGEDEYYEQEYLLDPRIDGTSPDEWGKFSAALSTDYYHGQIHQDVKPAFERYGCELRDNSMNLQNSGAAMDNNLGGKDKCACSDLHVKPDGRLFMCGCDNSLSLGNINDYDIDSFCGLANRISEREEEHNMCGNYGLHEDGKYLHSLAHYIQTGA